LLKTPRAVFSRGIALLLLSWLTLARPKVDTLLRGSSLYLLAPHTNGPREVPRCGALSLLQKTRIKGGVKQKPLLG
jgi:hypothetical protein